MELWNTQLEKYSEKAKAPELWAEAVTAGENGFWKLG